MLVLFLILLLLLSTVTPLFGTDSQDRTTEKERPDHDMYPGLIGH